MNQPLCKAPFMALRISADGKINPCCWMKTIPGFTTRNRTIKEYWTSNELRKLRDEMFHHKLPPSCNRCELSENNLNFQRIGFFDKVMARVDDNDHTWSVDQPMEIRQIDMNFSNKCNLKCRHCGPWNSTTWMKDYQKLKDAKFVKAYDSYKVNVGNNSFINDKEIFEHVKKIDFKGGEPMMQDEMYTLLDNLVKWDFAKNIRLTYITNGTKPSVHLHRLWKEFYKVNLTLSFEATGDLFEYVRGGTTLTWGEFNETIETYSNIDFIDSINLGHTLMNFTLFNLPSQLEWLQDLHTKYRLRIARETVDNFKFKNMVTQPSYLNILVLPKELKLKLIDQYNKTGYKALETISESLQKSSEQLYTKNWNDFVFYTKTLDKIRNENLVSIVPQFKDYIE